MTDDQTAQAPAAPANPVSSTPTQDAAPAQAQAAPAPQGPPPPVPAPVQQPIVSPIAAPVPPTASATVTPDAPYFPPTVEDHKGGLLTKLQDELKLCRIRRENLRTTELLIKEDGFIRHLEGIIGILRQYSFR
jgi:hypothetical protein